MPAATDFQEQNSSVFSQLSAPLQHCFSLVLPSPADALSFCLHSLHTKPLVTPELQKAAGQGWDRCQELINHFIILLSDFCCSSVTRHPAYILLHTQNPTKPAAFCNHPSGTALTLHQFDNTAPTPHCCFEAPFCVCQCSSSEGACCKASKQMNITAQEKALLPKILHFMPEGAMGDQSLLEKCKCRVTPITREVHQLKGSSPLNI